MTRAIRFVLLSLISASLLLPQTAPPPNLLKVSDPLVRMLAQKGIISETEAIQIAGLAPEQQRLALALALSKKGILNEAEIGELFGAEAVKRRMAEMNLPKPQPVIIETKAAGEAAATFLVPVAPIVKPASPTVIPAVAPLRVLQVDRVAKDSVIPDIKLGSGARLKILGFVKASLIHDTSSPAGTDMPLPYLGADTGPDVNPEFHVRARNMRLGAQFEWPDVAPKLAITGRFETDFEGSFTRALNRNISTVRSSQMSLRVAWGRADYAVNEKLTVFGLVGQDWTPFGSSTIPNLAETTGLGLGYGTLYERLPQMRVGLTRTIGGSRNVKFQPEIALTLPAFGNTPANISDQLGYGERQGADSGRPEVQGRFVTEWQFDRAPGVAPAQFILSFVQSRRRALVRAADVPAAFKPAFPNGGEASTPRYGYTVELQLPTRYFTLLGKYFRGADLRFYFVGGLYSHFNDAFGLTDIASAPSIDGASTVVFGNRDGVPVIAAQRPVRTQGYMIDVGFPISRLLGVNPKSRMAGWSANFHYSIDMVPARDARRMAGVRAKSDMAVATLTYKLNSLISFQLEESMYRTRAANSTAGDPGGLFLLRGIPSRQWHDLRSEFATLFTF